MATMPLQKPASAFLRGLAGGLWIMALAVSPVMAAPATPRELTVPGDFSIDYPVPGKLEVRTSPMNLPIYIFDDDPPGKSTCNPGCIGPWTPVV
ncbi:MAG: hypothetical protein ACYCZX_11770, partial [Rhodospirillaceae bacterium]